MTDVLRLRPQAGWLFVAGIALAAALTAFMLVPRDASAHETREVANYRFVVGFLNEPAFEGILNGVSVRITDAESEEPVEGVNETLQVEVIHPESGATRTMDLTAVWGDPGHYRASLVPTVPGQYHFRFFGTVGDLQVDELFESGPGRFNDIEVIADLQFPEELASSRELQGVASGARTIALDAEDAASSAQTMAYVGIGIGILGVVVGGAGVALALRRR